MHTAPHPLPRLRDHLRITRPGGFNAVCRDHGGRMWASDVDRLRSICNVDGCMRKLTVLICEPEEITGTVREISTSALGNPIVRIGTPGTRDSQWINWDDVETVQVLS